MDSEIIVALITAGGMGATALSGISLIRHRLTNVEKKLDEHNGYAKLYAQSHEDIAVIKTDLKYLKEDVKELKEREKNE